MRSSGSGVGAVVGGGDVGGRGVGVAGSGGAGSVAAVTAGSGAADSNAELGGDVSCRRDNREPARRGVGVRSARPAAPSSEGGSALRIAQSVNQRAAIQQGQNDSQPYPCRQSPPSRGDSQFICSIVRLSAGAGARFHLCVCQIADGQYHISVIRGQKPVIRSSINDAMAVSVATHCNAFAFIA